MISRTKRYLLKEWLETIQKVYIIGHVNFGVFQILCQGAYECVRGCAYTCASASKRMFFFLDFTSVSPNSLGLGGASNWTLVLAGAFKTGCPS